MPVQEPTEKLTRRQFLLRIGLLGTAASLAPAFLWSGRAAALHSGEVSWTAEQLQRALTTLTEDTMAGVIAFVVPGNDAYSQVQGESTPEPGGLGTRADLFLTAALDQFLPLSRDPILALLNALGTALEQTPLRIPAELEAQIGSVERWVLENLDSTLDDFLASDDVSLSLAFALLLNLLATLVNPTALAGPLLAPFSRLAWQEKAQVFGMLEAPAPELLEQIGPTLPEPLVNALPGLLRFTAGAVLEFSAFGSYSEWAVLDPVSRTLTARPLGWTLSGYQPDGPVEGWDEFKGYFQGRRSVGDA